MLNIETIGVENTNSYFNKIPFMSGLAHQQYLSAEKGIVNAYKNNCTHWYVDGSLYGEMVPDWNLKRLNNLNEMIANYKVEPVFHGNFKAPLASDVEDIRLAAVEYIKKEIDICSQINAPLIIHGGSIVEPKMVVQAKKIGIDNFLQSVFDLSNYAAERNIDIYLENLSNYLHYRPFHYIFTNTEEYEYIFSNLADQSNLYFFLDIGHANICDGNSVEIIRRYHSKIKGMSFSNNNGSVDQHFAITKGNIDYHEIVSEIISCSWKGLVAFETRGQTTEQSVNELSEVYNKIIYQPTTI